MDLEDSSFTSLDDTTVVTKNYLNDKIFLLNNKILDLKLGMKLLDMENKTMKEEFTSEIKYIRRLNKMLLGFVIVFEFCLIVALR